MDDPTPMKDIYHFPGLNLGYELRGKGIEVCLRFAKTLKQLDRFGLELAGRGHQWTTKERRTYERRVREFQRQPPRNESPYGSVKKFQRREGLSA